MYVSTKDELLNHVMELTKNFSPKNMDVFTANNISEKIGISRNLASQYLNELVKEDKLLKINSRPVYFLHKRVIDGNFEISIDRNVFMSMDEFTDQLNTGKSELKNFQKAVGYNTGIAYCVEQCKAAMKYPPNGLPILLTGQSGTGKSYLAQLMYEYAVDEGIIESSSPFISVNCSEYANNPELETANLFGYKKGAFAGAERDHKGLIQSADGGVLFLDEVQGLSPECQEKLFLFMDKGIYHLLGENSVRNHAKVKIIFATTKDPNEALLRTLLQRIPIIVKLPALDERSMEEKEEMIIGFFKKEAKRIHREIFISNKVFQTLMNYTFSGNIGQLKNCICTACANAFLHSETKQQTLNIYLYHLPEYVFPSAKLNTDLSNQEEKYMINLYGVTPNNTIDKITAFYGSVLNNYEDYKNLKIDFNQMLEIQFANLNSYYDYLAFEKQYTDLKIKAIEKVMEDICEFVADKYNIQLLSNCSFIMSRSIYTQMQVNPEIKLWEAKRNTLIEELAKFLGEKLPKEYMVAAETAALIKQSLDISLSSMGLILCLLNVKYYNAGGHINDLEGIIICHGYSTASSMASAANKLIGQHVFEAIDMSMDTHTGEIAKRLKKHIQKFNVIRDFILLVDMGSLEDIGNEMSDIPNINIGIINNVSTRLAVDVGYKICEGKDMESILKSAGENMTPAYKMIINQKKEEAIIFTSETSTHTAEKMAELFLSSLPGSIPIKIISYNNFKLIQNSGEDGILKKYHVLTIIGTSNPNIQGIPFIALEDIISLKEIKQVNAFLVRYFTQEEIQQFNRNILKNFSLQNVMQYLTVLNADKLLDYVEEVVNHLQQLMGKKLSGETILGIYVHLSCLVERLVTKNQLETHLDLEGFESSQQLFIKQMKESFSVITNHYGVEIPVSEIAYIYDYIANDEFEK
ncbi:sigma 54-interacting transcriptional regulator [Caproiciproducens galactitolivorans]|uniref:Sigma 54-interacting transcriptional regulator n=1 Tax=Caproiciproducens galactitolivorans TaxID=642589 RepID=A0ABT4BR81_9FIRM|nr:sigma 54-interacting transcriptional regulator [Caproiciproducens galactitolivorans]MCY1713402.1 sigma 54-interacting transcriptional regulator [Caproiciproducens galactitolivorans]